MNHALIAQIKHNSYKHIFRMTTNSQAIQFNPIALFRSSVFTLSKNISNRNNETCFPVVLVVVVAVAAIEFLVLACLEHCLAANGTRTRLGI